jgi:alpha-D-xyloside xylohydrolase
MAGPGQYQYMKPSAQSIGRSLFAAQVLFTAACSSGGSGGETAYGGASGLSGATGVGGMTGGTTGGMTGGTTGLTGNSGGAPTGGSGTSGASARTDAGGAGGAGVGGVTSIGGAGGTTARGGNVGTGAGGRSSVGGTAGTSANGGVTGVTGGTAAGGRSGGAGGNAAGGASGQTGLGGGGAAGQTSTGGTPAVACGPAPTCAGPAPTSSTYTADATGVTFNVGSGKMKVQVCQANILRVEYTSSAAIPKKDSLIVSNTWSTPTAFCVAEASGTVTITTACMKAKVNSSTGVVSYTDLSDNVVLAEASKSTTAATVESTSTYKVTTSFNSPTGEALYGLGQHQSNVMNRRGTSLQLLNSNTQINIPVLVSNKGYGLLWDNNSTGNFSSSGTTYSYSGEAGEMVDYYFFYGPSFDQVIAGYRTATGGTPMFGKWAYGLFHSKDKYTSQSELLSVMNGYRNGKIPLDCIVQDWDYWTPNTWGSHLMDKSRYADPAGLMNSFHTNHVHGMISIWPEYEEKASAPDPTDQDNFKALNALGAIFPSGGTHHFYDTYNAEARKLVFQQIYDRLVGKYGWDGIWADNTEPQPYPDSINMRTVNSALGKGALNINAYPLGHAKALYEGWRSVGPKDKRVYVLTRSAWAGQQRYAATEWSGDINCDFPTYAKQIPAGLNFAAAGQPYWTTDIGGYWGHPDRVDWTTAANNELFTRWFQYGAFCPIFRIHGGGSRELYGTQWSATTKANLLKFDNLRYRLMPYIYSLAWKVTSEGYTIMRPLIFDYPSDTNVSDIKDQFLFGPAFLVNPITSAGATSRSVYLPAGTWYDFWTGSTQAGGNKATMDAPLSSIPILVKAGSIVPMGPMIQYATESIDPLEIRIYKGGNASFTLYEDEGDSYNYETGKYSTIPFTWDDAAGKLTIGAQQGSYTGMPTSRTFNVVWVGANHGTGVEVTATADQSVKYDGSEVSVSAK